MILEGSLSFSDFRRVIALSEVSATGENVLIKGIGMNIISVPLHKMNLKSDLVLGTVCIYYIVWLRDSSHDSMNKLDRSTKLMVEKFTWGHLRLQGRRQKVIFSENAAFPLYRVYQKEANNLKSDSNLKRIRYLVNILF